MYLNLSFAMAIREVSNLLRSSAVALIVVTTFFSSRFTHGFGVGSVSATAFPWSRTRSGSSLATMSASTADRAGDVEAYNQIFSSAVVLSGASVSSDPDSDIQVLSVTRSVRDVDGDKNRKFKYTIPFSEAGGEKSSLFSVTPTEVSDQIRATLPTPSGDKIAVFREEPIGEGDDTRQVVELWVDSCQRLARRVVLPKKLHGKVCHSPDWFGNAVWNLQETLICYPAERNTPKTASFFAQQEGKPESDTTPLPVVGGQATLGLGKTETWGERYSKMSPLIDLYCLHTETGRVARLQNVPGDELSDQGACSSGGYTLGQPVFSPCGSHVVYTAWDAGASSDTPRRLGMIYCFQRPCKIYASSIQNLVKSLKHEVDKKSKEVIEEDCPFVCLTPDARLSRSPRFTRSRGSPEAASKLAFLTNKPGFDTHGGAMALAILDWETKETENGASLVFNDSKVRQVVEVVKVPGGGGAKVAGLSFPGLFVNQLPPQCFTHDNKHVVAVTQWGSVVKLIRVCIDNGTVQPLEIVLDSNDGDSSKLQSASLLCFSRSGGAVIALSQPNKPAVVAYISPNEMVKETASCSALEVNAVTVSRMCAIASTSHSTVTNAVADMTYEVVSVKPAHIDGATDEPIQGILLLPKDKSLEGKKPPLIVVPHGGPHSCTPTSFVPSAAFLCTQGGYAMLFVNFRGSTGFGQDALESLAGRIGRVDVSDVVTATKQVCASGVVDPDRVGICGGSHGGFLVGHCIGQYPELFKAGAMRNPVTNVASMVTASDIPDWCYVETFGTGYYNWKEFRGPTREELDAMWSSSPIAHIDDVVAPTLIALGMSDERVPPIARTGVLLRFALQRSADETSPVRQRRSRY